jgi:hypothetical protein
MLEPYYPPGYGWAHSHRHQFDHLGLASVAQHLVFITDSDLRLNQGVDHARDLIRQARRDTGRLPVLCLDLNPCDSSRVMDHLAGVMDPREYFVLDPDIRPERSTRPNQAPWPSWLIMQQISHQDQALLPRESRISMLSGSMRYHRLCLWRAVRPWIRPDDVVVINRMGHFASSLPHDLPDPRAVEAWQHELPWTNDARHVDHPEWGPWTTWQLPPDQGGNSHAAFRACVNITNETGPPPQGPLDQCLLSEKTWKAYRSGCLVINYGAPGAVQFLESQGLEIWRPWDQDAAGDQRTQQICQLWQQDDIYQQYQSNHAAVQHNRDLVLSRDFARRLAQTFLDRISGWI